MSEKEPTPIRAVLVTSVKAAVVIGAMSVLAANWLSHGGLDRSGMSRLAQTSVTPWSDPVTTGAITGAAASAKIDPCAVRPDRRR